MDQLKGIFDSITLKHDRDYFAFDHIFKQVDPELAPLEKVGEEYDSYPQLKNVIILVRIRVRPGLGPIRPTVMTSTIDHDMSPSHRRDDDVTSAM